MNQFLERLKTDKTLQLLIIIGIPILIIFLVFIGSLFGGGSSKKQKLPCYNTTLTIWAPFAEEKFLPLLRDYEKYCVKFDYRRVQFEELMDILPRIMVQDKVPDIVYVDRFHLLSFAELFSKAATTTVNSININLTDIERKWFSPWLGIPFFVDSLVIIYHPDILLSSGFTTPPETFSQLKDYISKTRILDENRNLVYAPISFGSLYETRTGELLLALANLNLTYLDRDKLIDEFLKAIDFYLSFNNPLNDNFSYSSLWPNGLTTFLQRKAGAIFGFYDDIINIKRTDPLIGLKVGPLPRYDNSPKKSNFTKVYYFAPLKTKNSKVAWEFIYWFYKNKLKSLSNNLGLIPASIKLKDKLSEEKRIVFEGALSGDTFDLVNIENMDKNINLILSTWQNKRDEGFRTFKNYEFSIFPSNK